jgi:uncharacterized protein (TIGR02266 family)
MSERKGIRKKFRTEVIFIANGNFHFGYSKDLSPDDIFIETSEIYPVGTELLIDFYLPGAPHKFKLKGRVMRIVEKPTNSEKRGMGIEFVNTSEFQKKLIRNFVERDSYQI